ncbi:unnamed protein product [Rotaria sp. Silwood1]|nr:unnamed protein product [Rotaria sp. Silwood1]
MSNRGALEGNNAFLKVTEQVITPIHCAAMNPNAKYLKQLLTITSEVNIPDKRNRRPIHYAAVCEGTEPMKYLLSKDAKFNEVDKEGNTPLHLTAIHGRHENAEVLLRTAKEKAELNDPENQLEHEKFGLASINRMNASEHYSLHLAVINNHLKCVEVLLQYGAEIDALTAVSAEKLTSLMLACRIGSLDIVKCLVTNEARVEAHDRFKRTPLIHACMYGHAHVVSYLLRIGANPNVFDSSMNTALHYAIAYGWYFCVRLLMEAGANANCANCWLMTCLGIGVLKGHFGICDYLLKEHKADINFKTDNGLTTVILPLRLRISKTVLEQLEYIVVKHNADCTCIDINGQSAFHYLALNVNPQTNSTLSGSDESELRTYYFRMAKILLEHGCSPTQMDNKAQTPLALALGSSNLFIVDFLINEAKVSITLDISREGKMLLHYFAMNSENLALTNILAKISPIDQLKKMVEVYDNEGRTPFHYCTKRYEEYFKNRHNVDATLPKYQSIVKMIRYFLETLDCDPDIPVKRVVDHNKEVSELNVTDSDMNDSNSEVQKPLRETSIFYLLYDTSYCGSANEHPLQILLKKSKNINVPLFETGRTPLLQAISARHSKTVSLLLQNPSCDVNLATSKEPSELGKTPLILACKLQYLFVTRELLNHPKCDLLARDHQQNQAFHYFLTTSTRSDEYLELFNIFIEKLLALGKDTLNSQGESGKTPLHIAVQYHTGTFGTSYTVEENNIDVAKLLLDKAKRGGDQVANNSTSDQNQDEQMKDTEINHTEAEAMDESSAFEEPTSIDLNATDALGRTCIHHLALPLLESYDVFYANNIELLELLHSAGASLIIPDQMGLTPLNYAAKQHGCKHLYDKLRELVNECPMEIEEIPRKRFIVNDPNNNLLGLPDYYSDAQQYIEEYIATQSMNISSSVYKVDPLSRMSETADVVIDSQNNEPFDVRLTITDVDDGLIGLYNFYRMQIIKQRTETDLYLLFSRWGRIGGSAGQHKLTPYSSIDECRAEFCKIFLEKTGNTWDNPNRFERQPKKYTVVQLKNTQTCKSTDVPVDFQRLNDETQHIPSKLHSDAYKNFFKMFLNSGAVRTNLEKANLDIEWMPVSQLKSESVKRARDILTKLKADIEHKDQLKLLIQQRNIDDMSDEQAEFKLLLESICQLTNEYYSVIPLQGYGSEKLPVIDTIESVRAHAQKLDDILELELSYKILLAAQANLNRMSPLDYLYKSINCQFEALSPDDIDSQFILRYIRVSAPNTKVEQIFKVSRANDDEHFNERNVGNGYLLWHGTNICNLISILMRGTDII